ncbi:MAG: hypothetical protein DDT26_00149 [Dehalococcoidia bacterium]|nr:hypothetical protein [Chloroflexota bacterium]
MLELECDYNQTIPHGYVHLLTNHNRVWSPPPLDSGLLWDTQFQYREGQLLILK